MSVEAISVKMGRLRLANPTLLASGVQGSSFGKVLDALKFGAGGAVTKSIGPVPRDGYPEPTLVEVEGGWVNAVGLPNPGAEKFAEELGDAKGKGFPIFVSVFGGSGKEFAKVVRTLDGGDFLGFELNLSCPHVEGVGTEIGHHPELVSEVVKAARGETRKPIFAKLSPNTDRLVEVAKAALEAGAEGLTAINTVKAFPIDPKTGRPALSHGFGGLSGGVIRPIALRCIYELRSEFDVPLMGCGGVSNWEDAVQFFLAGADVVQIGSATMRKPDIFNEVNVGILEYLERRGASNLGEIIGKAHGVSAG